MNQQLNFKSLVSNMLSQIEVVQDLQLRKHVKATMCLVPNRFLGALTPMHHDHLSKVKTVYRLKKNFEIDDNVDTFHN